MKKTLLSFIVLAGATLAIMAFMVPSRINQNAPQNNDASLFPEDIQKILEGSCLDCHSNVSSNEKAKSKLNFDAWGDLSNAKKVGKMQDITDIVTKGDMPPAKYLDKFPDKVMTKEQKEIIIKWATEESNKLMGQ